MRDEGGLPSYVGLWSTEAAGLWNQLHIKIHPDI